jgi:hypothetical protein
MTSSSFIYMLHMRKNSKYVLHCCSQCMWPSIHHSFHLDLIDTIGSHNVCPSPCIELIHQTDAYLRKLCAFIKFVISNLPLNMYMQELKKMTVYNLLHSFHKGYYISVILHIIISIYLLSSISVALTDNI